MIHIPDYLDFFLFEDLRIQMIVISYLLIHLFDIRFSMFIIHTNPLFLRTIPVQIFFYSQQSHFLTLSRTFHNCGQIIPLMDLNRLTGLF